MMKSAQRWQPFVFQWMSWEMIVDKEEWPMPSYGDLLLKFKTGKGAAEPSVVLLALLYTDSAFSGMIENRKDLAGDAE